jgi:SAM-dependent methyltransferase
MPDPHPLDLYLDGCATVHQLAAGTPETSFYPALHRALNAVGATLKPKVVAVHHVSGRRDAGIPDFGLFVAPPRRSAPMPEWHTGATPERGVVEVKPPKDSMDKLLASRQVAHTYLPAYGLVLATNLWQFRLVGAGGQLLERLDLADTPDAFWKLVRGQRPEALRTRFADFLQRCLLTKAPLTKPEDLAFFLASYARDALAALEARASLPGLAAMRKNLEKGLGLTFEGAKGEHLFRSTLVQTLFYGVFSAWVAHQRDNPGAPFDWKSAQWSLHVPVMQLLFAQVATPNALGGLGLVPLLDAAQAALARVDTAAFFAAFDEALAVQHFYEPFLKFFDPKLRKELGVWYTPPEIVEYMVERVDRVLRSELGIEDGLADERVWVLDPCCGTGGYLVEVLRRIRTTLATRGLGDLMAERMVAAATTRVVGFEIMPAPFVIAHWQVGEELLKSQAHLAPQQRAAIYLTNALTGWDRAEEIGSLEPAFALLQNERDEAREVKQNRRILVVLGNPPYNAFAGTSPSEERGLVEPYKEGLNTRWGVKKFNLDDLYVRFFRVAERRIADVTGEGVICFISNFSWLAGASFVVMRKRLLDSFDAIWIDNLNGDSRETGKVTPEGLPDPSAFSTPFSKEGIRVGTAIATLVKRRG